MAIFVQQLWQKTKQWQKDNARVVITTGAVSFLVVLLRTLSLLQFFELAALDQLFRLRKPEVMDGRIKIVALDQKN